MFSRGVGGEISLVTFSRSLTKPCMSSHHHSDQRALSRSNLPSSVQRVYQISFPLLLYVSRSAISSSLLYLGWFYYYSCSYLFITYVSTFVILLYLSVFDAVSRCTLGAGVASSFLISSSLYFYFVCWSIYFYLSVTFFLYLQKCCRSLILSPCLRVWIVLWPKSYFTVQCE